jgi:hypothetical protein
VQVSLHTLYVVQVDEQVLEDSVSGLGSLFLPLARTVARLVHPLPLAMQSLSELLFSRAVLALTAAICDYGAERVSNADATGGLVSTEVQARGGGALEGLCGRADCAIVQALVK